MSLSHASTLIIAGTSGIGSALARHIVAAGGRVMITGRDETKTATLAAELEAPYAVLDATDFAAVDAAMAQAIETLGPVNGVACCAGSLLLKPAHLTSEADYLATIHASLTTAFATTRAAGKHLAASGGGSVVLVSSAAAMEGLANHEAIAAAKAGISGLMRSAAASYASTNIRFNAVAPGLTETPLTRSLTGNDTARKFSEAMHALGRLGKPEQVAAMMAFLLNPANDWITGQEIGVDGGLSRVRPKK